MLTKSVMSLFNTADKTIFIRILFIFLLSVATSADAQYKKLYDFTGPEEGIYPSSSLISDGTFFYGVTSEGGKYNFGTIFKVMPDGSNYTHLFEFDAIVTGKSPSGSLTYDGTYLYGVTSEGGLNNYGTIFKINPDGTGFSKLFDFNSFNGSYPNGSLIFDGTFLYGMAQMGAAYNRGCIFKILPDGTSFTLLFEFNGLANGIQPRGALYYDGTTFYGTASLGGINNCGIIFKISPNGTGYTKLFDFAGITNGRNPFSTLISDGVFLYGMNQAGGINDCGTVFKILPNGTGFSSLFNFDSTLTGHSPSGSLIKVGAYLFGVTNEGGLNNSGTIFKIMTNGANYSKLFDFTAEINGRYPLGPLLYDE